MKNISIIRQVLIWTRNEEIIRENIQDNAKKGCSNGRDNIYFYKSPSVGVVYLFYLCQLINSFSTEVFNFLSDKIIYLDIVRQKIYIICPNRKKILLIYTHVSPRYIPRYIVLKKTIKHIRYKSLRAHPFCLMDAKWDYFKEYELIDDTIYTCNHNLIFALVRRFEFGNDLFIKYTVQIINPFSKKILKTLSLSPNTDLDNMSHINSSDNNFVWFIIRSGLPFEDKCLIICCSLNTYKIDYVQTHFHKILRLVCYVNDVLYYCTEDGLMSFDHHSKKKELVCDCTIGWDFVSPDKIISGDHVINL